MWNQVFLHNLAINGFQWHLIQNAQGGFFQYERYHPIRVQNRLREPHFHVYNLHAWLLQPVFKHGSDCRSGRALIYFRRRRWHIAIGLVIDWCVSGPNDVAQVWALQLIWVFLPFAKPCRHAPPVVYAVVSDIQDLWKFWVDFCKLIFYTYLGHNLCKKCGWHFFGRHLGYLAAILNCIILWTLFSINPLLSSNLLLLTSLYDVFYIITSYKYQLFKITCIGVSQIMTKIKMAAKIIVYIYHIKQFKWYCLQSM